MLHRALHSLTLIPFLLLSSCQKEKKTSEPSSHEAPVRSETLQNAFPLLPLIEPQLWEELLAAEKLASNVDLSDDARRRAHEAITTLSEKLQQTHPFHQDEQSITLGLVHFDSRRKQLEIPAQVHYPQLDQVGIEHELELILCTERGRTHETLFITQARPLHLELLLHLTGASKTTPPSRFKISVALPGKKPIPIEELILTDDGKPFPPPLTWEFSGSSYQGHYAPDTSGDLIICWHAHDAVMQIDHRAIANGEQAIKARRHPDLTEDTAVKLIITPADLGEATPK